MQLASSKCSESQNEPNFFLRNHGLGNSPYELLAAGVEFIDENGGGAGVRLRKSPKKTR
jgi:hypothetical protein